MLSESITKEMKDAVLSGTFSLPSSMDKYSNLHSISTEIPYERSHMLQALTENIVAEDYKIIMAGMQLLEKYEKYGIDFNLFRDKKRELRSKIEKDFTLKIKGFSSLAEAQEFAIWYSGAGESDSDIWFYERKNEGKIKHSRMNVDNKKTFDKDGNFLNLTVKTVDLVLEMGN